MNQLFSNVTYIDVPSDGSCLLHAISKAYYLPYQLCTVDRGDKFKWIRSLRQELSERLVNEYNMLSNGKLSILSKTDESLKRDKMIVELESNVVIDIKYIELINNMIDKDVYVIHNNQYEPKLLISSIHTPELLYKDRVSIIVHFNGNRYRLVGLNTGTSITTQFPPNHAILKYLRNE